MGNIPSKNKVHFEELQTIVNTTNPDYVIINTMKINEQKCIILNTMRAENEENTINELLSKNKSKKIIIYGKNYNDEMVYKKYSQLNKLGFKNIFIYIGGMFEWLCLQEIYGNELFKTTSDEMDILKYK